MGLFTTWFRPCLAGLLGLVLHGCGAKTAGTAPPVASARAGIEATGPVPSRAEVVKLADELAVQGSRASGSEGAALTRRAADWRRRIWRIERREADGLEAVELYRTVAEARWEGACAAAVDLALLQGELKNDPGLAYRGAYLARASHPAGPCVARAERILETLAGFRPLPSELAELDRRGAKRLADAGVDASSPKVRPIGSGVVVLPKLASQRPPGPVRITNIERYGAKDAARIVVFVTHPTLFDVGFLPRESATRGPRLYIDIRDAKYRGKRTFDVGGIVTRVRLGQQKTGTRVVLDLEKRVFRRIFYLPEPFRLVIDVSTNAPRDLGADGGRRQVRRVVLDPGHGGHDPGAVGPSGLREKDVTLDIAHRAAPLIARELGIVTLLTRDSDDYVPLDERAARANAFNADLFVSLHCNASENPDGRGVMTFVLDESRDALAAHVAARENAASPAAAAELATAMSRMLDDGTRAGSLRLASLLQRAAMGSLAPKYGDTRDQGVKRAGFYVLAGAHMPAALFETSFISNPTEEARLDTGDYRQKLADAVVNAIRAYREGK